MSPKPAQPRRSSAFNAETARAAAKRSAEVRRAKAQARKEAKAAGLDPDAIPAGKPNDPSDTHAARRVLRSIVDDPAVPAHVRTQAAGALARVSTTLEDADGARVSARLALRDLLHELPSSERASVLLEALGKPRLEPRNEVFESGEAFLEHLERNAKADTPSLEDGEGAGGEA